jgi:catechol 2,3-dioxygenase-like lactoylglutathione lyase family enzyme
MISGAHFLIYSTDAEADRAFLRDVLKFPYVDDGDGWLIFGLPPAEVGVHPAPKNDTHEFYLLCDNVEALVETLRRQGVGCSPITNEGWGLLTQVTLPSGGTLGIYQPMHARPNVVQG